MSKLKYRALVGALKLANWIAQRTSVPKENFRDAMGDAGIYKLIGRRW